MATYDLAQCDNRFSELVERAAKGEPLVIEKDGQPPAKVVPVENVVRPPHRPIGFMPGTISIPDDFDRIYEDEILAMFEGRE